MVFSLDLQNRRLVADTPIDAKSRDQAELEAARKLAEANAATLHPPVQVPDMRHALANPTLREAPVFVKSAAAQSEDQARPRLGM